MSNKVIQFKREEEKCECSRCDLVNDFNDILQDCESEDEFLACLRGLVDEAGKLAVADYLKQQVVENIEMIEHLEGTCECNECDCEFEDED